MIEYYGTKFLDELYDYYRSRYLQAKERGYDEEKSRYYWLFKELRERLLMLLQVARFLEALPRFMSSALDEQAIQYVTTYTSDFFKPELVGELERDQAGVHPFFNEANPYWTQMNEVLDGMDEGYDTHNLPLLYVDLCEYTVRAVRLYFQIREMQIRAIDREKFDAVMKLSGVLAAP